MHFRFHRFKNLLLTWSFFSPAAFQVLFFFLSYIGFLLSSPSSFLSNSVTLQFIALILATIIACASSPGTSYLASFNTSPNFISNIIKPQYRSRYLILILSIQFLVITSFFLNSNFTASTSSVRFSSIRFSSLHSLSLYLSETIPFLLLIAPIRNLRGLLLSPPWFITNTLFLLGFAAASGRGKLLALITQYLFVFSIRFAPELNLTLRSISKKIHKLATKSILSYSTLLILFFLLISFALSIIFALTVTVGGLDAIAHRVFNGFDQLQLINEETISIVSRGDSPIYPLVWLKVFLRPILPFLYDNRFDNYTEHLLYITHNKLTLDYASTSWAPNNLLFTDSILNFPLSLFSQALNTFILYFLFASVCLYSFFVVFTRPFMSSLTYCVCLPFAAIFYNHPFVLAQNSQTAINSILISILYFSLVYVVTIFLPKKG